MTHRDAQPSPTARPLLLTGLPRCGSSWVGRLLAGAPGVRYRYESLNPDWVPALRGRPGPFRYQQPGTAGPDWLQRAAERAFSGRQSWKQALRAIARGYGASLWRRQGQLVLKDPTACLLAGWLEDRIPCRVVVLTRHPCGFAASVTALGWPLRLERLLTQPALVENHLEPHRDVLAACAADPLAALGAFWAAAHLVLRDQAQGRWHFQSFDALCLAPREGFAALSDGLRIQIAPPPPRRRHRADPGSTVKEGRRVALSWRERFTDEEVARILQPVRDCGLSSFAGLDAGEGDQSSS